MKAGVKEVVCRSQAIILAVENNGEVFKMCIAVGINIVENHEFKETFHINHPCGDIRSDGFGDIFVAAVVFKM